MLVLKQLTYFFVWFFKRIWVDILTIQIEFINNTLLKYFIFSSDNSILPFIDHWFTMKRWVIAPIILFSVAYYAYIPLPEDAIEPYKQHIPALTLKIVDDVVSIIYFLFYFNFWIHWTLQLFFFSIRCIYISKPNKEKIESYLKTMLSF